MKETNLPKKMLGIVKKGGQYEVNTSSVDKFGQKQMVLKIRSQDEVECEPKVMPRQVTKKIFSVRLFASIFLIYTMSNGRSSLGQNKLLQLILGYIYILKHLQSSFLGKILFFGNS